MTMVTGIWQFYIPHITGRTIAGNASKSLDLKHAEPLLMIFGTIDGFARLEFVFDYYNVRYHLFVHENRQVKDCRENILLRRIAKDLQSDSEYETGTWNCLDLFWPFVAQDSLLRGKSKESATLQTRLQKKDTINIQLSSGADGRIVKSTHKEPPRYPLSEPIINPCPHIVRIFDMDEIELLEEVWGNVFKAKVDENIVCMKAAHAEELRSEINAMMKVPHHPNVIHPLLGIVSSGKGYVDKFLIPFVEGERLRFVRKATTHQKIQWKEQLSGAVHALHNAGLTWGDAAQRNVMIDKKSNRAILIDLGLSQCKGGASTMVDFEAEKMKDLAGLSQLNEFIDRIKLWEV